MKKFLLIAAAALLVSSVSAQKVKSTRTMPVLQEKKVAKFEAKPGKKFGTVLQKKHSKSEVLSPVVKSQSQFNFTAKAVNKVSKGARRAGELAESYDASGVNYRTSSVENWSLGTGVLEESNEPCLVNVIPSPFSNLSEIPVTYTVSSDGIVTIPPQKVAESSYTNENGTSLTLYVYLINPLTSSTDNAIHLSLGEDGSLTPVEGYMAYYFFLQDEVAFGKDAVFSTVIYYDVNYTKGGAAPTTMFDVDNAILFAGLTIDNMLWSNNLAITGADAPVSLLNTSKGTATSWAWSVTENEETPITSAERNFQFKAVANNYYSDFTLVGTNGENSTNYVFGHGNSLNEDGTPSYEGFYLYGSGSQFDFQTTRNKTYATMTRFNPDGDLMFYRSNWGTPDLAGEDNSFHKIISYQGKPSAPLYITGVTLPVILNKINDDFHLEMKIYKATEDMGLGELIASGTATAETVNDDFASVSGLTAISFPLSYEDEEGLSTEIDHIFIEDPFFIVIEGWDNGTFSATLGAQDNETVFAAQQKTSWFTLTGDETEDWYSWTGWNTALFIGLDGATYGFLHTEDNTNVTIPVEGGEATIHVVPMLVGVDDNEQYTTMLWLENEDEAPEWVEVNIANENYPVVDGSLTDASFDLVFKADALPAGVDGRQGEFVFAQRGALLKVIVSQGASTGINVTVKQLDKNTPAYNLAGQRVNADFKGLVIKNGKKMIQK